jgi:hypothetical protein
MEYRPRIAGLPAERFGVVAEGAVDLPSGEYELVAISDDGIRVWVDDRWVELRVEVRPSASPPYLQPAIPRSSHRCSPRRTAWATR